MLEHTPLLLVNLDLVMLFDYPASLLVFVALCVALSTGTLRRGSRSLLVVAAALAVTGIVSYFAANPAFAMLALSNEYAAPAAGEAERMATVAVGQAILAAFSGSGFMTSYILIAVSGLILAITMLQSDTFGRAHGRGGHRVLRHGPRAGIGRRLGVGALDGITGADDRLAGARSPPVITAGAAGKGGRAAVSKTVSRRRFLALAVGRRAGNAGSWLLWAGGYGRAAARDGDARNNLWRREHGRQDFGGVCQPGWLTAGVAEASVQCSEGSRGMDVRG